MKNGRSFRVRSDENEIGGGGRTVRAIKLNTELAKKPPEYLEYIFVHEMVHRVLANHNGDIIETRTGWLLRGGNVARS
jgi:predicted metal-dependent hydrolase